MKYFRAKSWHIRGNHLPILSEAERDEEGAWLTKRAGGWVDGQSSRSVPLRMPEILFGNSTLQLHDEESSLVLHFDARGALTRWVELFLTGKYEVIKVLEAKDWRVRHGGGDNIKLQEYDWTWATDYAGSVGVMSGNTLEVVSPGGLLPSPETKGSAVAWVSCPPGGIDRVLLEDQSIPILFYDEVVLYEDFIHDHGVVRLSVKIRVMPQCWYVLLRYWLRVDGVVMKVVDTRIFHKFGQPHVYRERTKNSITFEELRDQGISTAATSFAEAHNAIPFLRPTEVDQKWTPAMSGPEDGVVQKTKNCVICLEF